MRRVQELKATTEKEGETEEEYLERMSSERRSSNKFVEEEVVTEKEE